MANFWDGKNVLVTGACGFIGSHLTQRLLSEGANVKALVHYNSSHQAGWLQGVKHPNLELYFGDITDRDSVLGAVAGSEIIFHLAALIAIPYSYRAPESYLRTNVGGTINILQAARETGVSRVIHTSTSEVYGTARQVPITEEHSLNGQSPYSASKIAGDKFAEAYHLSFEVPVTVVRPFNTFGPRQSARAVIPTIITQFLANGKAKLGSLEPTRDLNFVDNTVDAFLAAARSEKAIGETIHFGSGREISIGDLAKLIANMLGVEPNIEIDPMRLRPSGSEVMRLIASNEKAGKVLDWSPQVSLETGLENTIAWIKDNLDHYQPETYSV